MTFSVNRKYILIKTHYFLFNAGVAPLIIFGSTIAKQVGLAPATVGLIYTCLPLSGVVVKTALSAIADRFNCRKLVFLLAILFCLISALSMFIIRTPAIRKKVFTTCHTEAYVSTCNDQITDASMNQLYKRITNDVITCEVFLKDHSKFFQEICYTENEKEHCVLEDFTNENDSSSMAETKERNAFFIVLHRKYIMQLKKCMYARITEGKFVNQKNVSEPYCTNYVNVSSSVLCDNLQFMDMLEPDETQFDEQFRVFQLIMLFVLYALNWSGMVLTNSMTDTICFDIIGNDSDSFGKQRLYGALGWGTVSVIFGWLVDVFSENPYDKSYQKLFGLASLVLICDLIVAILIHVEQKNISVSITRDVSVLFTDVKTTVFAFWCFLTGLLSGIVWQFLFWHLEDISNIEDLEWSKTLQGLDSFFTTIIGEIPFFFISGWIIRKLGHAHTMSLVLLACAVRLFGYSMLARPAWVLPIELVNGFTFSMCYVVIASYSNLIALRGTESTVQGLFSALFDGLGVSAGGFVGGFVYNWYNGRVLFRLFGFISIIAFLLHLIVQFAFNNASDDKHVRKTVSTHYSNPNDAVMILDTPE